LAKDFKKTVLILGIEDDSIIGQFAGLGNLKLLFSEERLNFFKSLDDETFARIRRGDCEVRYAKGGWPIHTKLYILKSYNGPRKQDSEI